MQRQLPVDKVMLINKILYTNAYPFKYKLEIINAIVNSICQAYNKDIPFLFFWDKTSKVDAQFQILNYYANCVVLDLVKNNKIPCAPSEEIDFINYNSRVYEAITNDERIAFFCKVFKNPQLIEKLLEEQRVGSAEEGAQKLKELSEEMEIYEEELKQAIYGLSGFF